MLQENGSAPATLYIYCICRNVGDTKLSHHTMFTDVCLVFISQFVRPPNVDLNTGPLKCPHHVGGGYKTRGNTRHMLEKVFFSLDDSAI